MISVGVREAILSGAQYLMGAAVLLRSILQQAAVFGCLRRQTYFPQSR